MRAPSYARCPGRSRIREGDGDAHAGVGDGGSEHVVRIVEARRRRRLWEDLEGAALEAKLASAIVAAHGFALKNRAVPPGRGRREVAAQGGERGCPLSADQEVDRAADIVEIAEGLIDRDRWIVELPEDFGNAFLRSRNTPKTLPSSSGAGADCGRACSSIRALNVSFAGASTSRMPLLVPPPRASSRRRAARVNAAPSAVESGSNATRTAFAIASGGGP